MRRALVYQIAFTLAAQLQIAKRLRTLTPQKNPTSAYPRGPV